MPFFSINRPAREAEERFQGSEGEELREERKNKGDKEGGALTSRKNFKK